MLRPAYLFVFVVVAAVVQNNTYCHHRLSSMGSFIFFYITFFCCFQVEKLLWSSCLVEFIPLCPLSFGRNDRSEHISNTYIVVGTACIMYIQCTYICSVFEMPCIFYIVFSVEMEVKRKRIARQRLCVIAEIIVFHLQDEGSQREILCILNVCEMRNS